MGGQKITVEVTKIVTGEEDACGDWNPGHDKPANKKIPALRCRADLGTNVITIRYGRLTANGDLFCCH